MKIKIKSKENLEKYFIENDWCKLQLNGALATTGNEYANDDFDFIWIDDMWSLCGNSYDVKYSDNDACGHVVHELKLRGFKIYEDWIVDLKEKLDKILEE